MRTLNHFVAPQPNAGLMRALGVLNTVAVLPGYCRVRKVHADPQELADMAELRRSGVPVFFVPNHPEFLTDWLMDKWLTTRVAPLAACWADAAVVNGMGRAMQRFWLSNNLVAAVKGPVSDCPKAHSVEWALAGHGVLLHPEGRVNWDNGRLGPLYPGAAQLACTAANAHAGGQALLIPLAWHFRFVEDASVSLHADLTALASSLSLMETTGNPAQRLYLLMEQLLDRCLMKLVHEHKFTGMPLMRRQWPLALKMRVALSSLNDACAERLGLSELPRAEAAEADVLHWLIARLARECLATSQELHLLGQAAQLPASFLSCAEWSQEQVAHRLRHIRQVWLTQSTLDQLRRMTPRGHAPRHAFLATGSHCPVLAGDAQDAVLERLRSAMSGALGRARRQGDTQLGAAAAYPLFSGCPSA